MTPFRISENASRILKLLVNYTVLIGLQGVTDGRTDRRLCR